MHKRCTVFSDLCSYLRFHNRNRSQQLRSCPQITSDTKYNVFHSLKDFSSLERWHSELKPI